jgi:hypothetical protein
MDNEVAQASFHQQLGVSWSTPEPFRQCRRLAPQTDGCTDSNLKNPGP